MYSSTSNSYWKERQNKTNRSPLLIATLVAIALAIGTILHRRHSTSSQYNNDILTQRRTIEETTDAHWKLCESQVNSKNECTTICQPERNSIQRKTMHQAWKVRVCVVLLLCYGVFNMKTDHSNTSSELSFPLCDCLCMY